MNVHKTFVCLLAALKNHTNEPTWRATFQRNSSTVTPAIAQIALNPSDLLDFWLAAERHIIGTAIRIGPTAFNDSCLDVSSVHGDVGDVNFVDTCVLDDDFGSR